MKRIHTPRVNARYWTAITLASVFGTNLGDLYAHESGLGIYKGLALLALLTAMVFVAERFTQRRIEAFYWLVIILIRTGATNIADYLAYRVRVPELILTGSLLLLLVLLALGTYRRVPAIDHPRASLPNTKAAYWFAMLTAGVLGTVVGDICEHKFGEGISAIALTAVLIAVLLAGHGRAARLIALYWTTIAVARTAGTAIGDWLAENQIIHIGLPLSTLLSGMVFLTVLVFWKTAQANDDLFLK